MRTIYRQGQCTYSYSRSRVPNSEINANILMRIRIRGSYNPLQSIQRVDYLGTKQEMDKENAFLWTITFAKLLNILYQSGNVEHFLNLFESSKNASKHEQLNNDLHTNIF